MSTRYDWDLRHFPNFTRDHPYWSRLREGVASPNESARHYNFPVTPDEDWREDEWDYDSSGLSDGCIVSNFHVAKSDSGYVVEGVAFASVRDMMFAHPNKVDALAIALLEMGFLVQHCEDGRKWCFLPCRDYLVDIEISNEVVEVAIGNDVSDRFDEHWSPGRWGSRTSQSVRIGQGIKVVRRWSDDLSEYILRIARCAQGHIHGGTQRLEEMAQATGLSVDLLKESLRECDTATVPMTVWHCEEMRSRLHDYSLNHHLGLFRPGRPVLLAHFATEKEAHECLGNFGFALLVSSRECKNERGESYTIATARIVRDPDELDVQTNEMRAFDRWVKHLEARGWTVRNTGAHYRPFEESWRQVGFWPGKRGPSYRPPWRFAYDGDSWEPTIRIGCSSASEWIEVNPYGTYPIHDFAGGVEEAFAWIALIASGMNDEGEVESGSAVDQMLRSRPHGVDWAPDEDLPEYGWHFQDTFRTHES